MESQEKSLVKIKILTHEGDLLAECSEADPVLFKNKLKATSQLIRSLKLFLYDKEFILNAMTEHFPETLKTLEIHFINDNDPRNVPDKEEVERLDRELKQIHLIYVANYDWDTTAFYATGSGWDIGYNP